MCFPSEQLKLCNTVCYVQLLTASFRWNDLLLDYLQLETACVRNDLLSMIYRPFLLLNVCLLNLLIALYISPGRTNVCKTNETLENEFKHRQS